MLINLSSHPSTIELGFLNRVLTSGTPNVCLVSGNALPLAFRPKPFETPCVIRSEDANKVGGNIHSSWQRITDQEWLALIELHKSVSW